MRVEWRRLRAGELDHELIWLLVTGSAAVLGFSWLALGLPWPTCSFRALTGWPCVTCGATRGALAFLHGEFAEAWRFNPLVFLGICAVIVFDLYALVVLTTRSRRVRVSLPRAGARKVVVAIVLLVGLANWLYVLRH